MRSLEVVELEVARYARTSLDEVTIGVQVDLFVFQRAPQPLDEDVVQAASFAVHADAYSGVTQNARERLGGELRPLVCVEDFGLVEAHQRFVQRFDAEAAV